MGRVPYSEFNGSRVRFQRLSDQRIFSGWVKSLGADRTVLTAEESLPVESQEKFLFQVQGESTDAYFIATNTGLPPDVTTVVHGSTAIQAVDVPAFDYEFKLITRMELRGSLQLPRKSIQAKVAKLSCGGRTTEVLVADASAEGMGLIAWVEPQKGDMVEIEIKDRKIYGSFTCEVKHCRPEKGILGAYRIGLQFKRSDRVSLGAWRNLLSAV